MVSGIFIYLSFANVLQGRKSTACVQLQGPFVLAKLQEEKLSQLLQQISYRAKCHFPTGSSNLV